MQLLLRKCFIRNIPNVKFIKTQHVEKAESVVEKFENKTKGTMVENWIKYWKNVYRDYKEVVIDTGKEFRDRPIKCLFYLSALSAFGYCAVTNPDEISFRECYIKSANDLLLVHPNLQKREAVEHLRFIDSCYNKNLVRRLNLGIASVMWIDNFSDICSTYEYKCSYLQTQKRKFFEHVLDIGFLDTWWILQEKMVDYDINY